MTAAASVHARLGLHGDQVVEIVVDRGYRPQSIVARAGMPLRLVFHRRDDDPCADRIVFSAPHVDRRLARDAATTIVLPAQPPGKIRFTCGMGRYHGQIELRRDAGPPLEAARTALAAGLRLGRHVGRQSAPTIPDGARRGAAMPSKGESEMLHHTEPTRAERRAKAIADRRVARRRATSAAHREEERQRARIRTAAFGVVAVFVLGAGVYLAAGDLFGQRGAASTGSAIPVRMSMAGFTPGDIRVPAGQTVALELWTTDGAPHLHNGVHTMISDELGIYEELPAAGPTGESRRVVQIETPATPGTYDIYCDTCCGGKASPTMHGRLVVEA